MRREENKTNKKNAGFTLVELIVVIAILAVIAAIAAPALINNISDARKKTDITNAKQIADAVLVVVAKSETLAAVPGGEFQIGNGTPAAATLQAEVEKHLQSKPKPKYAPATNTGFFVTYNAATGLVTVRTATGAGGSALYPIPGGDYSN